MLSETVIISSQGSVFDGGIGSGLGLLISASESSRSFPLVNDKYTSIIKITSNCYYKNILLLHTIHNTNYMVILGKKYAKEVI